MNNSSNSDVRILLTFKLLLCEASVAVCPLCCTEAAMEKGLSILTTTTCVSAFLRNSKDVYISCLIIFDAELKLKSFWVLNWVEGCTNTHSEIGMG